jgi:hypothetical protein
MIPLGEFDDFGCAVLISVDYAHNSESEAREFFSHLYTTLMASGFNFDNRIFYKIAPQAQVEAELKSAIKYIKSQSKANPQNFLRSVHLIPLSKFHDVTAAVAAAI